MCRGFARLSVARHSGREERLIDRASGKRFADMADLERAIGAPGGESARVHGAASKQYLKLGG